MDAVRKIILERLAELRLDRKEISLAMGRNATYLHQFLHRGTPVELREADRLKLAQLLAVPESELKGPSTRNSLKQNTTTTQNLVASKNLPPQDGGKATDERPQSPDLFAGPDLPVFGVTPKLGQIGVFMLTQAAVDWTSRPLSLARVQDAYGIIINDPNAPPRLPVGSIALVHPHLPPSVGDACIFRCREEGGSVAVRAREYRGETESQWKVREHHPIKDTTLKKVDWSCHKTVGAHFL